MQVEKNPLIINQLDRILLSFIEFAILYSAKLQSKAVITQLVTLHLAP